MTPAWAQPAASAQLYLELFLAFAWYFAVLACLAFLLYLVFVGWECFTLSRTGRRRAPVKHKTAISGHAKITIFPIDRRHADLEPAGSRNYLRPG